MKASDIEFNVGEDIFVVAIDLIDRKEFKYSVQPGKVTAIYMSKDAIKYHVNGDLLPGSDLFRTEGEAQHEVNKRMR